MRSDKFFSSKFLVVLLFTLILTIFTTFSISLYKDSFSVKLFYLNNEKPPFYLILHMDSKYNDARYLVEVFSDEKGDKVYSHVFKCKNNHCEKKVRFLNNVYIGNYTIKVSLINKKEFESKFLNFSIKSLNPGFKVSIPKVLFVKNGLLNVSGVIHFNHNFDLLRIKKSKFNHQIVKSSDPLVFFVSLVPKSAPNVKKSFKFVCSDFPVCSFNYSFNKEVVLGDYDFFISNKFGSIKSSVRVDLWNSSSKKRFLDLGFLNKGEIKVGNVSVSNYFSKINIDKSILKESVESSDSFKKFSVDNGSLSNLLKKKRVLDKLLHSVDELKFMGLKSETNFKSVRSISADSFVNNERVLVSSKNISKSFSLNDSESSSLEFDSANSFNSDGFSDFSVSFDGVKVLLKEILLDGSFRVKLLDYNNLSGYMPNSDVSVIQLMVVDGTLLKDYFENYLNDSDDSFTSFNESFYSEIITSILDSKELFFKGKVSVFKFNLSKRVSSFNFGSLSNVLNSNFTKEEDSILNDSDFYVRLGDGREFLLSSLLNSNKLKPGFYKVRIGNSSKLYAFGLVSVNTKKPIYHSDEDVEFLLVVLDKRGFLVQDADLFLNVKRPNGKISVLSTDTGSLVEVSKGVYYGVISPSSEGKYELYAEAKENDGTIVSIESYFFVNNSYPFEIIRDVPPTIDPWSGPFLNNFTIISYLSDVVSYDLYEYIPSSFKVYSSNANKIFIDGESKVLVWKNISPNDKFNPYYVANSPLISPYLYRLGRAKLIYRFKSGLESVFFENRSWLFAIDPAVKVCDSKSACICGSLCAGGHEPGSGTIDSCSDGDVTWEFVKDIRITDLNHSYFGTGDTVRICVDFDCDSSGMGDMLVIGYKDERTSWSNSDIIFSGIRDTTDIVTICVNKVLNDYEGVHHVRGAIQWSTNTPSICFGGTYRDHDDINFTVLRTRPSYFQVWNLSNGSDVGSNLYVIRGSNFSAFASWDREVIDCNLTHNGSGSSVIYNKRFLGDFWSNFTLDTSNTSDFTSVGPILVNITCKDKYFEMRNTTSPSKVINILGSLKINQSVLTPYIMYNGSSTTVKCQVIDKYVSVPYSSVRVYFYNNKSGFLGSSLTDSNGWASYSYVENDVGQFKISCNVSDDITHYFVRSDEAEGSSILTVRDHGDITPPVVNSVSATPSLFSVGGVTQILANVTDNINLLRVYLNVTLPNGSSYIYPMKSKGNDLFEYNFSNSVLDGVYKYYVYAFDNSSNKGWSNIYSFTVSGIRTFIGIKTTKSVYKIGEDLNLTPYSKVRIIDNIPHTERGDLGYIFFDFDSGFDGWTSGGNQNEWENGVPSSTYLHSCDSGNCLGTDLNGNYNSYANEWVMSPNLNLSGRFNTKIEYWRELVISRDLSDHAFFEVSSNGGSSWGILYQNTIVPTTPFHLSPGKETVYDSSLDNSSTVRLRFRLTSNSYANYDGWAVDSVNVSFDPRVDWKNPWVEYSSSFGSDVSKLTAIKVSFNITSYSASGSVANLNDMPDLEVQIYNGSAYSGNFSCNLDSSKSYPYKCEFVIKNTPEFLNAWKNASNRRVRVRAIGLDHNDYISWSNVIREYITPSILENHGQVSMTSFLLEQFKNSTGGVVKTMYNKSVSLNPGETKQLSDYWSFKVPSVFSLGAYYAYVALTGFYGNVLFNDDDGTPINDSYMFYIQSLLINVNTPAMNSVQNVSFLSDITLDTTYFGAGGWCAYNLDNSSSNVTMNRVTYTHYTGYVSDLPDGKHNMVFYCNDSDDYIVSAEVNFNVSVPPKIYFVNPTDINGSSVARPSVIINVTLNDTSNSSLFVDFNRSILSYLNFENVSGSVVNDFSSYSNNGVLMKGADTYDENIIRGRYLSLDGFDDYLNLSSLDSVVNNNLTDFSISLWVKLKDLSRDMDILSKGPHVSNSPILLWRDELGASSSRSDIFSVIVSGSGRSARIEGSTNLANDSEWHHIVVVFKANDSNGLRLYVDGVEDSNGPVSTVGIFNVSRNSYDLLIGKSYSSGYEFDGFIDEFFFFKRAITNSEVKALYRIRDNWMFNRYNGLKNGNYSFYACGIDTIGNINCTEERSVKVIRPLPTINIISPQNYEKFSTNESVPFNVTLSESAANISGVWMIINNNGTRFYLSNCSLFDWNYSLSNFTSGWYNVTFYGLDIFGNLFNSSIVRFIVIPNKFASIVKSIRFNSSGKVSYKLLFENYGKWSNYNVIDFVNSDYYSYIVSPLWNDSFFIFSGYYSGNLSFWNVSIPVNSSFSVNGSVLRCVNCSDLSAFIVGLD